MEDDQEVIQLLKQISDSQEVSYSIVEPSDTYVLTLDSNKIIESNSSTPDDVQNLLHEWNLMELYTKFKEEAITIDVLKVIRPEHVDILMRGFKLGTQISFGHNLHKWRNSIAASSFYNENVSSPLLSSSTLSPSNSISGSACSTPEPEKWRVSLACVLNETNAGSDLTNYYEKHKEFKEKHRISLINAIAEYYCNKNITVSLRDTYSLEKQIVERFPSEKIDFYRTSKRGRLYNKFSNLKHSKKLLFHPISLLKDPPQSGLVVEENVEEIIKSIKHDNLSIEDFEHFWKACSRYRVNDIKNSTNILQIFEKWPEYKLAKGYRLIDIDFKVLYPTASSILDTWESSQSSFLSVLENEEFLNNKEIKANLSDFNLLSQNGKEAVLLWASHGCLGPSQRSVKKTEMGKNHVTRFSIKDSQNAFLLIHENAEAMEEAIRHKISLKQHIQPFIFVIGENVKNFNNIFIYFDGVKYPTKSFIRAVDVCFKIFYLFDLEYPQQCSIFWKFVESFFFKMNVKESNTKISVLRSAITKYMKT